MFEIVGDSVLELQVKAAESEAAEMLTDEDMEPSSRVDVLRQVLQMKERAANAIFEELKNTITRLSGNGVSSVSLFEIACAFLKALEASASQMEVFASELAGLIHNTDIDIEDCYVRISERIVNNAENLIKPLKESKEKAVSGVDSMIYAEIYETWNNLQYKPI